MRVVSYNVRYFSQALWGLAASRRSLTRIAAALAELEPSPHIVCLQEVEDRSLRSRSAGPQLDRFVELFHQHLGLRGSDMRYRQLYFPAHQARWSLYGAGQAILIDQRLTLVGHQAMVLSDEKGRGERRICAHVELRDEAGQPLHVFNTHLSLPAPLLRTRFGHGGNQLAQTRRLTKWVHQVAGQDRFVLCGDFNAVPGSPVHRYLVEVEHLESPHGLRPRLDYLFSGNGVVWSRLDDNRSFRGLSDHLPLIARI